MKRARTYGSSIFKRLPQCLAKSVAFFLRPHIAHNLSELVELLLCFPIPYLSVTLHHPTKAQDCLDSLEAALSSDNCPVLQVTVSHQHGEGLIDIVKLFLRSCHVEYMGLQLSHVSASLGFQLLRELEISKNKAHGVHLHLLSDTGDLGWKLAGVTPEQLVGEIIMRDKALLFFDITQSIDFSRDALAQRKLNHGLLRTKSLCYLSLKGVGLNSISATSLFRALASQKSIELLNVSENPIGDEPIVELAQYLKTQTTLRFLMLCSVGVTAKGACALAKSLEFNGDLDLLSMKDDALGAAGGSAFASMLMVNTTLRRLYLEYNELEEIGCRAFIEAIAANTTLKHLKLNHCNIKANDKAELIQIANSRQVLEVLELEDKNEMLPMLADDTGKARIIPSKPYAFSYSFADNYVRHLIAKGLPRTEDYVIRALRPAV